MTKYLFNLRVAPVVVEQEHSNRAALDYQVLQLRNIKESLSLRAVDLLKELHSDGFDISKSSFNAYLNGYTKDQMKQADLLRALQKIEKRMRRKYSRYIDKPMRALLDEWAYELQIDDVAKNQSLAIILGHDQSTIFKWHKYDIKPKPLWLVIEMQKRVYRAKARITAKKEQK